MNLIAQKLLDYMNNPNIQLGKMSIKRKTFVKINLIVPVQLMGNLLMHKSDELLGNLQESNLQDIQIHSGAILNLNPDFTEGNKTYRIIRISGNPIAIQQASYLAALRMFTVYQDDSINLSRNLPELPNYAQIQILHSNLLIATSPQRVLVFNSKQPQLPARPFFEQHPLTPFLAMPPMSFLPESPVDPYSFNTLSFYPQHQNHIKPQSSLDKNKQQDNKIEQCVYLSEDVMGAIIGNKGESITEIRSISGAEVQFFFNNLF